MWMYFVAGACLLIAIIFVVKFFVDNKKSKKDENKSQADLPDITINEGSNQTFSDKVRKDLIIAFVFMALCEICILIGNKI